MRKAEPGADSFNNVPRYDLAAYELQKLFLDPAEYVVPPTALRMVPLADFAKYSPDVQRTFPGADDVLAVVQYWLSDVTVYADVYDAARFATDPVYARHIGQLNVFTYLIEHRDSNVGNFLIGGRDGRACFLDRSWRRIRVGRQRPRRAVERHAREATAGRHRRKAAARSRRRCSSRSSACWRSGGSRTAGIVAVAPGPNLRRIVGVRRKGDDVQMGLTQRRDQRGERLLRALLKRIDRGDITTYVPAREDAEDARCSRACRSGIATLLAVLIATIALRQPAAGAGAIRARCTWQRRRPRRRFRRRARRL